MASEIVEIKRIVAVRKVLDEIASGATLEAACESANIASSTWRLWRAQGILAGYFRELGARIRGQFASKLEQQWPDVVDLLLKDATSKTVTASERDKARRTLLICLKTVGDDMQKTTEETGENAKEWLAKRHFPSIAIGVNVNVEQPRQAGNFSPVLTNFSAEDVVDAEATQEERAAGT